MKTGTLESFKKDLITKEPEGVEILDEETENDFYSLCEEIKDHLKNKMFTEPDLKTFIENMLILARKVERMKRALENPILINTNSRSFPDGYEFLRNRNRESSNIQMLLTTKPKDQKERIKKELLDNAEKEFRLLLNVFSKYMRGENV